MGQKNNDSGGAHGADDNEPERYDGRIKVGEIRNRWGRAGKPKPAIEQQSLAEIVALVLCRSHSRTSNGEEVTQTTLELFAESMVASAIKSNKVADKRAFLKIIDSMGVLDKMMPLPQQDEDPYLAALEEAYRVVEAEYNECVGKDGDAHDTSAEEADGVDHHDDDGSDDDLDLSKGTL